MLKIHHGIINASNKPWCLRAQDLSIAQNIFIVEKLFRYLKCSSHILKHKRFQSNDTNEPISAQFFTEHCNHLKNLYSTDLSLATPLKLRFLSPFSW